MAKETGRVTATREAMLRLHLSAGERVECLVDTSCSDALVLPQVLVARLNLSIAGREVYEIIGGWQFIASVAFADIEWLGERPVQSESSLVKTRCSMTDIHIEEVQMVTKHKDPTTLQHYDHARENLDSSP